MPLQVKRIHDAPQPEDGFRILVDRLWPRGISKEAAAIDSWMRECAPSDELRKWFAHDRSRWDAFRQKYFAELDSKQEVLAPIRHMAEDSQVTLLFAAADSECNNAVALLEYLNQGRDLRGKDI